MPAEIIVVANHKGGVQKTTTAVSLAGGLAAAQWRILLVDCDAQGNSTSMFVKESDDLSKLDDLMGGIELDLSDVIMDTAPIREVIVPTRVQGLDLLPATLKSSSLDISMFPMYRREDQVRAHLQPVVDDYDAIILDLPPNLGVLVVSALGACDSLIIPTDASLWGLRGVYMFLRWTDLLRTKKVLHGDLLGVLLTKYEPNLRVSELVKERLQQSDLPVFETVIPKRTAAERMVGSKTLVGEPGADPDMSSAYLRFTKEVVVRATAAQEQRGRHSRGAS